MNAAAMFAAFITHLQSFSRLPRSVHILCAGTFLNRAGNLVVPFLTIYLSKDRGLDAVYATSAIGIFGAGALLGSLIGGQLADRYGPKPVMIFSLVSNAIWMLLLSLLSEPVTLLFAIAVLGLIADLFRPASQALIASLVPTEERPRAYSLVYVSINLGFMFGALVGGYFAERSFRYLFWGDAATTLLFACVVAWLIKEPAKQNLGKEHSARFAVAIADILANRAYVIFIFSAFLTALVFHQGFATLPLYFLEIGMNAEHYGQLIALNGLLIAVFQLPLTAALPTKRRGEVLALGGALIAVGIGLTTLVTGTWTAAATILIWTLGEMLQAAFMMPVVADLAPPQFRARYFGVFSMSFGSAMCSGPPLGGWALQTLGSHALWLICFAVGSISALIMYTIHTKLDAAYILTRIHRRSSVS